MWLCVHQRQAGQTSHSCYNVSRYEYMATMVQDKQRQFTYLAQCIQIFLLVKEYLVSLLKATARTSDSNTTTRQIPAYISHSQGIIERFHKIVCNQIRALTLQLNNNYKLSITNINHPWQVIRRAAYLLNRFAIHNDGNTSYLRRWNKEHTTRWNSTLHDATPRQIPWQERNDKWVNHWHTRKDYQSNNKWMPDWTRQARQTIDGHHQCTTIDSSDTDRSATTNNADTSSKANINTRTNNDRDTQNRRHNKDRTTFTISAATTNSNKRTSSTRGNRCLARDNGAGKSFKETTVAIPKETTARWDHTRRESKQERTTEQHQALQRPHYGQLQTTRIRINAVTTKRGETITTTPCEDEQEAQTDRTSFLNERFTAQKD